MNDTKHLLRLQDVQALLAGGSLDAKLASHAELARRLVGANSVAQ